MSMKEIMNQELAEAIATLNKANGALARIFGIEQEGECAYCEAGVAEIHQHEQEGEGNE